MFSSLHSCTVWENQRENCISWRQKHSNSLREFCFCEVYLKCGTVSSRNCSTLQIEIKRAETNRDMDKWQPIPKHSLCLDLCWGAVTSGVTWGLTFLWREWLHLATGRAPPHLKLLSWQRKGIKRPHFLPYLLSWWFSLVYSFVFMTQKYSFKQHVYWIFLFSFSFFSPFFSFFFLFFCVLLKKATGKVAWTDKAEVHVAFLFWPWCREWAVPLEKHFIQGSPDTFRGADLRQEGLSHILILSRILCKVVQLLVPLSQSYSKQRQSYCVWISTSSYYSPEQCQSTCILQLSLLKKPAVNSRDDKLRRNHIWVLPFTSFYINSMSRIATILWTASPQQMLPTRKAMYVKAAKIYVLDQVEAYLYIWATFPILKYHCILPESC